MKMRCFLLSLLAVASVLGADAKSLKGRVVSDADGRGVGFARLVVEYPDTIVSYEAGRNGKFSFEPLSFPVAITVRADGMLDSTIGLMSMPDSKLTVCISPDPDAPKPAACRRVDWSTSMTPRLRSTYIVRAGGR